MPHEYSRHRLAACLSVGLLATASILAGAACTDDDSRLSPVAPSSDDTCIICEGDGGTYINPWVDSVYEANGHGHNAGLATVLVELDAQAAALGRPLTSEEAIVIARPIAEDYIGDYLADLGTTLPASFSWENVEDFVDAYWSGEDIVASAATPNLSTAGRELAYEILPPPTGYSADVIRSVMDYHRDEADDLLIGAEREAFIAATGVGHSSASYWEAEAQAWDDVLAASYGDDCGRRIVATDIAGAIWGAVHTRTWQGALATGLGSSVISGGLCFLGI